MDQVKITSDENKISNEESVFIYDHLRKKYCNENASNLEICLNLCFALLRLILQYVPANDQEMFVEKIIMTTLKDGIKK
jgi:hypothetical protein